MRTPTRLKLVSDDGVAWFSEELMLDEGQTRSWIATTFQSPMGVYLKQAERLDIPSDTWKIF